MKKADDKIWWSQHALHLWSGSIDTQQGLLLCDQKKQGCLSTFLYDVYDLYMYMMGVWSGCIKIKEDWKGPPQSQSHIWHHKQACSGYLIQVSPWTGPQNCACTLCTIGHWLTNQAFSCVFWPLLPVSVLMEAWGLCSAVLCFESCYEVSVLLKILQQYLDWSCKMMTLRLARFSAAW